MGNFKSYEKGRNDRPRGGSRGGFGGNRGGFDRGPRRPVEMHDAVCAKCNQDCQVPFKPRDNKSVLCRDCFSKEGSGRSDSRGPPRRDSRGPRRDFSNSSPAPAINIKKLEAKVDKILELLESLIIEEDEGEAEEAEEEAKKAKKAKKEAKKEEAKEAKEESEDSE